MKGRERDLRMGEFLRACRVQAGFTQESFDALMGWGANRCRRLELGQTEPTLREAVQLARFYGVGVAEIVACSPQVWERAAYVRYQRAASEMAERQEAVTT